MEPKTTTNYSTRSSKHHLFAGSSSFHDQDIAKVPSSSSSSWSPNQQKRQRSVIPNENGDSDPSFAVIIGEDTSKSKQQIWYDADWQKNIQIPQVAPEDAQKSSEPVIADSTSNQSDECDDYDDDCDDYDDDEADYEDDEYDPDLIVNNYNYNLAAKFDDLDLPPGVEATVPWLQKPPPEKPRSDMHIALEEDIDIIFKSFKQFDTVEDYSDHHFAKNSKEEKKPPSKEWMKKIHQDWKVLEKDLPETIFVRVYEERMDLLRAAIVGPAGTPYHDGLFFFDFQFPFNYPYSPPKAYYHSGGLRLNPNLYACGKVCLSLLNTWHGEGCERWNPQKSTMLQVLVSIQALVLNDRPYFNEPGYESTANTRQGEKNSFAYNETAFLLSCKTMMYSLRRPPKHFEDFVSGHFRKHGHSILVACRAYLDGTEVGAIVEKGGKNAHESAESSGSFKAQLRALFEDLLMEFTVKGADCSEFLAQKVKAGDATAVPKEE